MEETTADLDPTDIRHNYYRFAYDLVEKVLEIRKELNPYVTHNLPEPPNRLFTEEHATITESLLNGDTTELLQRVHETVKGEYNYENYLICRDFIVQEWLKRAYSEKSFISACASTAYVAALFIRANFHCRALDDIIEYIAWWVEDILKRGTIDNSSWCQ